MLPQEMFDDSDDLPQMRRLTDAEIAPYATDGVICARDVVPDFWLDRIARAIDRHIAADGPNVDDPRHRGHGFVQDVLMSRSDADFAAYIFRSALASVVQQVLGAETVRFYYDQLFVKEPGSPFATPWHHDITFFAVEGAQVCSAWMSLDRATRASGCIRFVRGSHLWEKRYRSIGVGGPTGTFELSPDRGLEDIPDIEAHPQDFDIVDWELNPGDLILFSAGTLHGSGPNSTTSLRRRVLTTRWCGDDVIFTGAPKEAIAADADITPGHPIGGPRFAVAWPPPIRLDLG